MIAEILFAAAALQSQAVVKNPRVVEFVCPDHDRDTEHRLTIFASDGRAIQTILLGHPAVSPDGIIRTTINVQPIDFQRDMYATVVAVAGTAESDASAPSNRFDRVPGAPSAAVVK